ncbi:hypothetical protein DYB32_008941, partial [Aphanomyces invadans]
MHEMSALEKKILNDVEDMTEEDELCEGGSPPGDAGDKKGSYETTEDIEDVDNVDWELGAHFDGPRNLFEHGDGGPDDELRVIDEIKDIFKDPVKVFLAFMPLDYWKSVVKKTNDKAMVLLAAHAKRFVGGREWKNPFDLAEVMKFIGLLVMMSVVRGGEYSLYWLNPSMSFLMLNGENFGKVMPINRFKQLRACIAFNDVPVAKTADATTKSYVNRRIGGQTTRQECLSLVGRYNMYMQGVDRHDQLRERFSIGSGASFKHWYRKLGFALIDIAITNLFVLWSLSDRVNRSDAHMYFPTRLAKQMLFEID